MWTQSGVKPLHQQPHPQENGRTSHGPDSSDNRTNRIFLGKVQGRSQKDARQAHQQAEKQGHQRCADGGSLLPALAVMLRKHVLTPQPLPWMSSSQLP